MDAFLHILMWFAIIYFCIGAIPTIFFICMGVAMTRGDIYLPALLLYVIILWVGWPWVAYSFSKS